MKTRFYVLHSGRKIMQYANRENAAQHAKAIGGEVKELPFTAAYCKTVGVRGGHPDGNRRRGEQTLPAKLGPIETVLLEKFLKRNQTG